MTRPLSEVDFIDLYLKQSPDLAPGPSFFKGLSGLGVSVNSVIPAPTEFHLEIEVFRSICIETKKKTGRREFSFVRDGVLYRVAEFINPHEGVTFVIRQKKRQTRGLSQTGLGKSTIEALMTQDLKGAVLVFGEMSAGKTSTIAAAIEARLATFGGVALVLEDPIETHLSGAIGKGLALQLEVTKYAEELVLGMRSNADFFMVGEIRDGETASEVLQAGSNGHLLFSSAHAQSISHGLGRIRSLVGGASADVCASMSQSLALIIHQTLIRTPNEKGDGWNCRLNSETLRITGSQFEDAIRTKIATGKFESLKEEIQMQRSAARW